MASATALSALESAQPGPGWALLDAEVRALLAAHHDRVCGCEGDRAKCDYNMFEYICRECCESKVAAKIPASIEPRAADQAERGAPF